MSRALDRQCGGDHYKSMGIEPIEYGMANGLMPCEYSIVKYVSRWRQKGGIEDLRKAQHFLEILIEHAQTVMSAQAPDCVQELDDDEMPSSELVSQFTDEHGRQVTTVRVTPGRARRA